VGMSFGRLDFEGDGDPTDTLRYPTSVAAPV
jgi:hypothetical protein